MFKSTYFAQNYAKNLPWPTNGRFSWSRSQLLLLCWQLSKVGEGSGDGEPSQGWRVPESPTLPLYIYQPRGGWSPSLIEHVFQ